MDARRDGTEAGDGICCALGWMVVRTYLRGTGSRKMVRNRLLVVLMSFIREALAVGVRVNVLMSTKSGKGLPYADWVKTRWQEYNLIVG